MLAAQVTVSTNGTANGIQMTQGTALGASSTQVSIFAMGGSVQRGEINNGGTGPQLIAIWPCTSAGCIPYAANSTGFGETGLPMGAQGLPLLAGPSPGIPQWGALPTSSFQFLDLQANALATEVANSSTAATTLNELVVFVTVSGGSVATTPTTTPTQGVEGICVASCGISGTYAVAQIAREGIATCAFDSGGTTAGDYVQASSITVGKCADAGSTYPTNGSQVLGRVLATHSGTGNVLMVLYPPGTGVSSLSFLSGATLAVNNALTLAGTGGATITFQGSGTYISRTTTDILSNKTIDTAAPNTIKINGTSVTAISGGSGGSTIASADSTIATCAGSSLIKAGGSGNAGNITCGAAGVPLILSSGSSTVTGGSTTQYFGVGGVSATTSTVAVPMPQAGTISMLACQIGTAITTGSFQLTLAVGSYAGIGTVPTYNDTSLTCTLNTTNAAACQDTNSAHNVSVNYKDGIVIHSSSASGTTSKQLACSVIFTP